VIVRKILAPLAGLLVGSVALGACNADLSATAAHVDGSAISEARLDHTMSAIGADAAYRCVLSGSSGSVAVSGAGEGTYATTFAASLLTTLVEERALQASLAGKHLHLTSFGRSVATSDLEAQLAPPSGSSCTASGSAVLSGLPQSYRSFLVQLQTEQAALMANDAGVALTASGMRRYAAAHPTSTTLECVSAIEVTSKAEATSLAAEARSGAASFASLAKKYSIDQSSAASGGALGCVLPAQLTSSLSGVVSALSPGSVSTPVAFGPDYVVFQLTSRVPASASEVASVVLETEASKDSALVVAALKRARVAVDPQYGHWKDVAGVWQVAPPVGPPSKLLENSAAVTPPASTSAGSLG